MLLDNATCSPFLEKKREMPRINDSNQSTPSTERFCQTTGRDKGFSK